MKVRNVLPVTLLSLLSCNKYPQDANLSIVADPVRYGIYGDSGDTIAELGAMSSPSWLYDLEQEIRIEIALDRDGEPRVLYEGFYLDETRKRLVPDLSSLLDKAGIIGADCGFHHPDSHDYCPAGVKVSEPVTLTYRITPFPGERNTDDNTTRVTLSIDDLKGHAQVLSSNWYAQEQKEAERERQEVAEKNKGWK